MQKIPLKGATQGMILAEPVKTAAGLILVGAGTELTESILNRLLLSGIPSVTVKGRPTSDVASLDYNTLLEKLDSMFRHFQENTFMQQMQEMFKKYFQIKLAEIEAAKQSAEEEALKEEEEKVKE